MNITVDHPAGPRTGVVPFEGINSEIALLKSLVLTLALERRLGAEDISISLDLRDADPERLVAIARIFSQMLRDSEAPRIAEVVAMPHSGGGMLPEVRRAGELLTALQAHILEGRPPLHGYREAARLIRWNTPILLPVGQICSRLDLAAYDADLPMLALNWIRRSDGSINQKAFSGPWVAGEKESIERMVNHQWRREHFDLLRSHLEKLPPNVGAARLWQEREKTLAKGRSAAGQARVVLNAQPVGTP